MAASVRIEDEAFADARIAALGELAGYNQFEALGRMAHLWRLCTQRGIYVVSETLVRSCLGRQGVEAIVGAELGECVPGGVRVKGTEGRIEWIEPYRNTSSAGGKARAATANRVGGRFVASDSPAPTSTLDQHDQHAGPALPALTSAISTTTTTTTTTNTERSGDELCERFDQVATLVAECGGRLKPPGYETQQQLARLLPKPRAEVEKAIREMLSRAAKPNWGYLLECLRTPIPKARGSPGGGVVGYHPGSTTFGDGDVKL